MSKQRSNETQTRRFSGPELSELLDQVAREHGADAAISAVNRIRSGGVAGFFCREEFEVVITDPSPGAAPAVDDGKSVHPENGAATPVATRLDDVAEPEPESETETESDTPSTQTQSMTQNTALSATGAVAPPASGPGDPASDPLRVLLGHPHNRPGSAVTDGRSQNDGSGPNHFAAGDGHEISLDGGQGIFGGPKLHETNWTDPRFRALVDRRLEEASSADAVFAERRARRPVAGHTGRPPVEPPNLQPIVPAPGLAVPAVRPSRGIGVMTRAPGSLPDFWLRLQRTQHELSSFMPLNSSSVATIGPLSLITPVVRRLRSQPGFESADVIVLTNRAEIVSEPSWELVRSGNQLLDAVAEKGDWPILLLIDVPVELPNWVAPLENRLRLAGVGLFRFAVPGNPTAAQLDDYRLGSDVPYVIDLVSRVQPERLVEFIALRHPIASVAGAELNAELLVAMREQVGVGP